jgi:2-dehydropantoate 2-reductase
MRICVFGAGSLGSFLGGMLAEKHTVTLVGRRKNMDAIRTKGLTLVGDKRITVHPDARETVRGILPPELLIICTKAYDTEEAIRSCRSLADDETLVLTLQNGLGNLDLLRKWKKARAFGGTTTAGAFLQSPGVVRVSGLGGTVIGSDLDRAGSARIVRVFSSCGLPTSVTSDVVSAIWSKAIVNACINPTAAILRVPNGRLLKSAVIERFMEAVCEECKRVAKATGEARFSQSLFPCVRTVCKDTSKNISSMLQDVLVHKQTEIMQINGAFCEAGDRSGMATPLNDALVAMITSLGVKPRKEKG